MSIKILQKSIAKEKFKKILTHNMNKTLGKIELGKGEEICQRQACLSNKFLAED